MTLKTEMRPTPLPRREWRGKGPRPPEGADGWSTLWLDASGMPQHSPYPVPVDEDNRRTAHERFACSRGKIEIEVEVDGKPVKQVVACDQTMWLLPGEKTRFCPDHGCEMSAEATSAKTSGLPWGKVWDVADERVRVAAVTAAAGVVGAVDDVADLPWWGDAAEFAAMPAVVWSSWWLTRWWLTRAEAKKPGFDPDDQVAGARRRRKIARRARIAAYAAGAAVGWERIADLADWTTTSGRAVVGMAALAGLGVVCSRPYRAYVDGHRKTTPVVEDAPAVESAAPSTPPGMRAAARWVADDPNGAVPNTILLPESYRQVVGGWGIIIRATKPGAVAIDMLTDQSAKGRLRVIAGTFGVNRKYFNFVEQDDPNDVLMLVQPNPPLAQAKVWAGPESIDVDKGVALTGYYIDGSPMFEPFYRYGWGAPSKIVTGTTGSGKSENLRKQLVIERYFAYDDPGTGQKRGLYASFLHDFKQFESYGEFRRAVHAAGSTVEDAYIMRDALIREMNRRYDMLASHQWVDKKGRQREGGISWDPRVHGPILSWTIDEFHEIAKDKEFIGPLELLARKMRACGIRVVIGTHMGTLGDTGSRGLRDMLAGGYALFGRTTDSLTSVVTGGTLTADPRQLPKLPGMCLVADGEQQTMHARQSYIPSDEDAPVNVYDLLFDDNNEPIGFPAVLPPETLEVFGPEWVAWAEAGRQLGGRPAGTWASGATAEAVQTATAGDADVKGAKEAVASILLANGGPMDIDAIDEALKPMRARGVRCQTSMARKVLRELVEEGFAFKPKHGSYQINDHVQEDLLSQLHEAAEDAEQ
ncbi:hypothetical protein AB0I89_23920 [Micromonospora sp. NPDC049801]|uniref:hypothetical protein n=1 Tax=unclassified Micromonospora TaxID=2617518 RepID=UPI0033D8796B